MHDIAEPVFSSLQHGSFRIFSALFAGDGSFRILYLPPLDYRHGGGGVIKNNGGLLYLYT